MSLGRYIPLLCLLLAARIVLAGATEVRGVRIATDSDRTRVALDLTPGARHRLFTLSGPPRVVVDIAPGRIVRSALPLPAGQGVIQRIRTANRKDGSVRIVLDLKRPVIPKSFMVAADGRRPDRLVIDLHGSPAEAGPAPVPVRAAPKVVPGGGRDIVVAIDPGHGGKDPGAHGPSGKREKDVVLGIGRRLADTINREPGMRAVMTRSDDRFLNLRQRMESARSAQADLFISIHADAFRDSRVRGATVYVLSDKGATDEAARRLAERENRSALVGGVDLGDKDAVLASVLLDLSQNASIGASFTAGQQIIESMGGLTKVRKRKVQQAPFLVLKSPDVPSVLIETAFISNPSDERNLASPDYQGQMATAIFSGVREYFHSNPPEGTRLAALQREGYRGRTAHVIRRGDTLSELADRYKVSVRQIRDANRLHSDTIRVGQVLNIPPTHEI